MSADLYRVIALTSVETDATECALSDDNAVFQLIELAQQISRVIKSDAGIAVFRPEHGDASVVGIAKTDSGQALQLTKAATDVLAERQRQIDVKGWTPEHDDGHGGGSLSLAATAYIEWPHCVCSHSRDVPVSWPWDPSDFKPKDRRTNLCKATALLLAEIERYDRAAAKGGAT